MNLPHRKPDAKAASISAFHGYGLTQPQRWIYKGNQVLRSSSADSGQILKNERGYIMENDNSHLLWIFLFLSVIFLFTWFISLYRERKARKTEKICIYCLEPRGLWTWGAEHPLKCAWRHPRLSLQGTFSYLLSELSRTLGLIVLSDFFIRIRDSAEDRVKKLGEKRRKKLLSGKEKKKAKPTTFPGIFPWGG